MSKDEVPTLFEELSKATGLTPQKDEDMLKFSIRMTTKISELDDDGYNKLSKEAQTWFDASVKKMNSNSTELPALDGFPTGASTTNEETVKTETTKKEKEAKAPKAAAPAVAKPAKAAAAKAAPAAKPAKPAKEAKAPKAAKPAKAPKQATLPGVAEKGPRETTPKKDSTAYKMRLAVVTDPAITYENACKKAKVTEERGGNAWNAYQNAKQVMAIHAEVNA